MALLHLSELPPQRAAEAYALVRLSGDWSEEEWRQWLAPDAAGRRGVLSVTAFSGVLLGLAAYEVHGSMLDVPLFLAFELGAKGATREALREGLDQLGERLGCETVRYGEHSRGLLVPSHA